jgi:hypothetical protein
MRLAVMTFTYENDREIAFDLLDSVLRSCPGADIDLFFTDDASPSRLDGQVMAWCSKHGVKGHCLRYEENLGFRGAVERTLRLLNAIALQDVAYDAILRIDTDALVIRPGLDEAMQKLCSDRLGLYGVLQAMRPKDRMGWALDLLPVGLKRQAILGAVTGNTYSLSRWRPVWWWKIGILSILRGFRFKFVQGSCYMLGGDVPGVLLREGFLSSFNRERHGLVTSEEDVVVTMMCKAAGVTVHEIDRSDRTWRNVNYIGEAVLSGDGSETPYVIHPLKATAEDGALREKIKRSLPLFQD